VDCADIRDVFLAGELPTGPEAEEHVRVCPHCRELVERHGALGQRLGAAYEEVLDPELLATVERDLAREQGPRAWLRSLSTPLRFTLVLLTAAALFVVVYTRAPRPDFAVAADDRWYALAALLILGVVLGADGAVRVLGRAQPSSLVGAALTVLVLPLLIALLPEADSQGPLASAGVGPDFARASLRCLCFGVLISAPLGTLLWFASREDRLALSSVIFVAGAAGVGANLALHAHCAISHPGHLIAGHATVGFAWLLALLLMNRLVRAR
jgi:hypothetical protein